MKHLLNLNRYLILGSLIVVSLSYIYSASLFMHAYYPQPDEPNTVSYLILKFAAAVLFAPLVETLIFQHWLIRFSYKKLPPNLKRKRWFAAIFISALLFGLGHTQNAYYVIFAFIMGLLLAGTYVLFYIRKDMNPILAVFLVHAIANLVGFILDDCLGLL